MNRSIPMAGAAVALAVAATMVAPSSLAQTTTKKKTATKHKAVRRVVHKPAGPTTAEQIHELQEQLQMQQGQISGLQQQLQTSQQQLTTSQQTTADAQSQAATAASNAAAAQAQAAQAQANLDALKTNVTQVQQQASTLQDTMVANQAHVEEEINSPTVLHYKGVTLQPVGFFAMEGVWRQRAVNSDINTPFNSIPVPSANEGHISELNFSGRQSRLGLLVSGDAGKFRLSGYFEGDFLGSGVTSNNNQSNSYVFRQRQAWAQGSMANGFTATGGQMWSLVTEDGRGTDNRTEVLPNTIDPQYMVGFNWTRQPGIRLQQRIGGAGHGSTFTVAVAAEQAQITNFTVAGSAPTNYYFAGAGANGGLYNAYNGTYANNLAPDLLVKVAADFPHGHIEVGGIARFLRDQYYPILTETATSTTATTYTYSATSMKSTTTGGGAFGAIRVMPTKMFEVGVQAMGGPGVGRYGSSQLADATLRPNGSLEPIKNYHGLGSLIAHATPKLDVYAYYGGEYAQRTVYLTATGQQMGYGDRNLVDTGCYALPTNPASSTGGSDTATGTCASPTRYIQEGMFGFTYQIVKSPRFGRLQYQAVYSYLQRNLWSGVNTTAFGPTGPRAEDQMIHMGMRYYIP